jgi:hypothetical protein
MNYFCCFHHHHDGKSVSNEEYLPLKDEISNSEENIKKETKIIFFEIQELMKKPFPQVPVSKDILRLYKKIRIFKNELEIENMDYSSIYSCLLVHLGEILQPKEQEMNSMELFQEKVNLNDYETLSVYLMEVYHDYDSMLQLLKLCNQSLVLIIARRLKLWFSSKDLYFKDVRGSWFIDILLKESNQHVVLHKRKEICYKKLKNGDHFPLYQIGYFSFPFLNLNLVGMFLVR